MRSTLIISFSSCVFKYIKKICDLKKDFSEDEKSYSIFPAGAFAKNLFIFHFFKVIFGGISAAELLSSVAFRRQRFSNACRVRIIELLQLFPIGLYGLAVVFVSERSVRKIGSDFRPHRLPVGEKCRTRKTAFPTFCEQPCACCDSNNFARRIQSFAWVFTGNTALILPRTCKVIFYRDDTRCA